MEMLIDGYIFDDKDGYNYQYLIKSDIGTLAREIIDLRAERTCLKKSIDNWQAIWFFTLIISLIIGLWIWIICGE